MTSKSQGLERNAIGLTEVLFQSITFMAPAVAVALSIGFATTYALGLTPLAVVLALIAVLFTAFSMGELARHLPSAGGLYTYVGRGLGSYAGWLLAWAYLLASIVIAPVLFAAFGFFGADLLTQLFGPMNEYLWIPLTLLCAGIVWYLTYRGVSISTRTGVALGLTEIVIMVFVSALLVINAGSRNTISVFIPGDAGIQPAFQGMVFCLLAFVGFEAAAPLAEETRDPKRNTRRAIVWSAIAIGVFYVFCYYAATVYFGPDKMADFISANSGNPWGGMAEQVLPGIGSLLVTFAILNSCLANANSGANASTRSIYALGRSRLLPAAFGTVHPTHRTPATAIHLQAIVGIIIAVGLSLYLGNQYPTTPGPLNTYFTIGYAIGLSFAAMYMAVNFATIGYFWREQRAEFSWFKHLVIPIIGFIAMIPAFFGVLGGVTLPILDLKLAPLGEPYSYVPPLVGIWMLVGVVIGLYFWFRERDKLKSVREAMGETDADADADARLRPPDHADPEHAVRPHPAGPEPPRVGPGHPAGGDGRLGRARGVRLPRRVERAADGDVHHGRPGDARLRAGRPGHRPRARSTAREPGDTLQVDVVDLEPADWGWTATIPGFGLLADEFPDPFYKVTAVPGRTGHAEFWPGIRVPLAPFCGEMGVAPANGPLSTIPPDVHGGNMDTRHLVVGSTLFLPVFVPGARFSIGDGHATQGDGEVCGTAIETPMQAVVRLTVRKDVRVTAPEFLAAADPNAELRSGPRYATDGVGPDLMAAARDATRRMIDWMGREHGLDPVRAYLLCSVAVDLRISEIVDMPNVIVTAHCPLGIFD